MASRKKGINNLPRNTSWQKMDMEELADLLSNRTGLDEGEIRQVLQELDDTSVFMNPQKSRGKKRRG